MKTEVPNYTIKHIGPCAQCGQKKALSVVRQRLVCWSCGNAEWKTEE